MPIRSRTTGTCEFRRWRGRLGRAGPLSDGALTSKGRALAGIAMPVALTGAFMLYVPELKLVRRP
jgi:hypothetical protein